MATKSAHSSLNARHTGGRGRSASRRPLSRSRQLMTTDEEAYISTLRVAYLTYLLQPRQKRIQHVANTSKPIHRQSTSIQDMVKDFTTVRDSKSTRFPHGFMAALDKRITGVLMGQEKGAEYNDALVKRTFATFLNEFKNPTFRKNMEKDRRVEDLLLIFFSKATSELQKGKSPEDDSWKLMVDRHVALFVRLISGTMNSNDWSRDRPELTSRLKTLETKLLQHDQDLAAASQRAGGSGGQTIEVEIPRSYEVRDMALVVRVASIFAKPTMQVQNDINAHKEIWTEEAAVRDLKDYQNHMTLSTGVTLTRDDFATEEVFETWRKGEVSDLSQLMLTIMQNNPELAKTTSGGAGFPGFRPPAQVDTNRTNTQRFSRTLDGDGGTIDHSLDMSRLDLDGNSPQGSHPGSLDASTPAFTFIPTDVRAHFRHVLRMAVTHDLADFEAEGSVEGSSAARMLSKPSQELIDELAIWWRLTQSSRTALFLDVVRELYQHGQLSLDTVDATFMMLKDPPPDTKRGGSKLMIPQALNAAFHDRSKWTVSDGALAKANITRFHDALLREFFENFQQCYDTKPPSIGPTLYVLENHIIEDPFYTVNDAETSAFTGMLAEALQKRAEEKYHEMLAKHIPGEAESWEFFNVVQFGRAVLGLIEKVQKRYRKSKVVMGVNPLTMLVQKVLPNFGDDAKELVSRIMILTKQKGEEIPIQDGFDLYKELVSIRSVWTQALPARPFSFPIEGLLQDFVWRWISASDAKLIDWVEGAVAQDDFSARHDVSTTQMTGAPTDEVKHSQSAVDVYRIFNQSIDQVKQLNWADNFQYAKFMTAISKSIGRGVTRYCELLEKKFMKEMDRQTPEQELRAQQSQREKWMAVARDVWATGGRERIEPFQFWPESFVKINDIEYATLQLDKLEGELRVDELAEVINAREPVPPPHVRARQGSKFMFTIKIIEAEDLKAGDLNGLSDPYVVLGDEYQKRLAKTRIVYQSLNPRWDETVDILTSGPLNVIATVWDWDAVGDHDCLGRTSLKLDPTHFNDYLPREYWLDLDTQGRVLVRVSMEGERDDIQFHFGKAFRTLKRTERDMTRSITDKLKAYIQQCLSRRTLKTLCNQNITLGNVTNSARGYFSKLSSQVSGRPVSMSGPPAAAPSTTPADAARALAPLTQYFDDNFAIMKQTLTDSGMITVMTRLWKEVLVTIEGLLVPPLSDKISAQRPLSQQEVDIVYKWLEILFDFFHAADVDEQGRPEVNGVPLHILKSAKYHDLQNLNFFYFESTENLIRTSEGMARSIAARQQETAARLNRLSAPTASVNVPGLLSLTGARRTKSVMLSRNLGTMRKAKEEKRREAQADPNDDMILRILRMRPEAERYLKDRSRQKERLAAAAAAEAIVRQSLQASRQANMNAQGGGRGNLNRRYETIREDHTK